MALPGLQTPLDLASAPWERVHTDICVMVAISLVRMARLAKQMPQAVAHALGHAIDMPRRMPWTAPVKKELG